MLADTLKYVPESTNMHNTKTAINWVILTEKQKRLQNTHVLTLMETSVNRKRVVPQGPSWLLKHLNFACALWYARVLSELPTFSVSLFIGYTPGAELSWEHVGLPRGQGHSRVAFLCQWAVEYSHHATCNTNQRKLFYYQMKKLIKLHFLNMYYFAL